MSKSNTNKNNWLTNFLMPKVMAFVNTKAITSVKDGMMGTMPLLITGSIFLILSNLPIKAAADFMAAIGVSAVATKTYAATFNISAILAAFGIAYTYAKLGKREPVGCGFISIACFFIIQPNTVVSESGDIVGGIINQDWTAGKGMIGAILCGLAVGCIYTWFLEKDIRIKMPAGVPAGVSNAFTALVPGAAIITIATIIHGVTSSFLDTTLVELIYKVIQIPLQGLTDSLPGALMCTFVISFLWFFGVHGSTIVIGIVGSIWMANYLDNQALLDAGQALNMANGGHIVTSQFFDNFIICSGSGITIGIVIYCVFMAKSTTLKTMGRLEAVPACFNINEPFLFGLPIVMNPIMAVPFILVPLAVCLTQYLAIATGLCPMYTSTVVPWTTPPIISGLIIGGWRTALLQVVCLTESFLIYLPFIRKMDLDNYEMEQQSGNTDDDDEDW